MVSIIILSYNTEKLLRECLTSLKKVLAGYNHEIIVVDNASLDDSVKMIKNDFPEVVLIESNENLGFAKGCNLGAESAKGDLLLFLNSDTTMENNSLPLMSKHFTDEKVGIVGGALRNYDSTPQRSYAKFYHLPEVFLMLFGGDRTERFLNTVITTSEVDWVSGGFMMIRKSIFDKIGGFDGRFFMYIEDMELCFRVKKKGYKVYHEPNAVVSHLGQGSSNKGFAIINIFKGLKLFYKKHKSSLSYAMLILLLSFKANLSILIGKMQNNQTLVDTYQKALA